MEVNLRLVSEDDRPFLRELYASTRADEMALTGWPADEIATFLSAQFELQDRHYREQLPPSLFQIIEHQGKPIGRLYTGDWEDNIRLIDIALTPEYRNQGIGTRLVKEVMQRARERGKPVQLHVEPDNPACRLYERLGFRTLEHRGVYLFMEWCPGIDGAPS